MQPPISFWREDKFLSTDEELVLLGHHGIIQTGIFFFTVNEVDGFSRSDDGSIAWKKYLST